MFSSHAITEKRVDQPLVYFNDKSGRSLIREFVMDDITRLQEIDLNVFFVHLRHTYGGPMGFLNAVMAHQKQKDRKDYCLAVVDRQTSVLVGSVMIYDYKKDEGQAELAIFLDNKRQSHILGADVCSAAMRYFGEALKLRKFYATIHPSNVRSKRMAEGLGFVQHGDVFVSHYLGDPGRADSYDREGHLIQAPRIGYYVSYEDFLSKEAEILCA